jgi:hypothetical protein
METRKTVAEIMKVDGRVRLLLGGILLDGALFIALVIAAGLAFAL